MPTLLLLLLLLLCYLLLSLPFIQLGTPNITFDTCSFAHICELISLR